MPGCATYTQVITDDLTTRLAVPPATLTNPLISALLALVDPHLFLTSARPDAGMSLQPKAGDKHCDLPSGSPGALSISSISLNATKSRTPANEVCAGR